MTFISTLWKISDKVPLRTENNFWFKGGRGVNWNADKLNKTHPKYKDIQNINKLHQSERQDTVTWEENLEFHMSTKQGQMGDVRAAEGRSMDNLSGLSGCGATEGLELTGDDWLFYRERQRDRDKDR